MKHVWALILVALCASSFAAHGEGCSRVSGLKEIPIARGINKVPHFGLKGEPATIIRGSRFNGNAHGNDIYMILIGTNIVGSALGDVIHDEPFTGEAAIKSVRFARGKCDDGPRETFLVTATRKFADGDHSLYTETKVEFVVFRLFPFEEVGTTDPFFAPVLTSISAKKYINSDWALFDKFGFDKGEVR
jgi:hypothetical protein